MRIFFCLIWVIIPACDIVFPYPTRSLPNKDLNRSGQDAQPDFKQKDQATVDAGQCSPLTPFHAPQKTPVVSEDATHEDDPALTGDLLEIYFNRQGEIWRATRPSIKDLWSSPVLVAELNSPFDETTLYLTPAGLTIFFASRRNTQHSNSSDIYFSTRQNRSSPWSLPVPLEEINTSDVEYAPRLSPNQLILAFSKAAGLTNKESLHYAKRQSLESPWSTPVPLKEINLIGDNADAWINDDLTVFYFSSNRPGGISAVGNTTPEADIWLAIRPGPEEPFTSMGLVENINTPFNESDVWLSPNGRTIYFSSNRDGTQDIFFAER